MSELTKATTWTRVDGSAAFTTTIDERWTQGKGAFGGLLAAGLLRAMAAALDDDRRVARTLHVHYCAPARPGPLSAEVAVERTGASMTTVSARALQDGKVVTLATATFAAAKAHAPSAHATFLDTPMPAVAAPADLEPFPADVPLMPRFTQFFEYRMCIGEPPFSSSTRALLGGWVRVRDAPPGAADAATVAALIDAYPPAILPRLDAPRASASVNLTIDFLAPPATARADAHFLLTSASRFGDGATTDEQQELWSEDGALLASCRQLVVLL